MNCLKGTEMVTTVELQDPFEYSWWVYVIAAVILAAALALLIYVFSRVIKALRVKRPVPPVARHIRLTPERLAKLKQQYIAQVHDIMVAFTAGRIDKRDGYQKLSAVIRSFVHEVTGINVENYTREVKAMGIRMLDTLMEEYYVPEFAEDERGKDKDLVKSCQTAMGVIRSWS